MGIYLNRGNDAFRRDLSEDIYVDKSMLISKTNEAIEYDNPFWCVTRLRRSGKTMAIKMLNAYYSKGCDSRELFHGLKIESDPSYGKHLNKHNVITIDIGGEFCSAFGKSSFIPELSRKVIKDLRTAFPDVDYAENDTLINTISRIHDKTGETFIFLIDEWDMVFQERPDDKELQEDYLYFLRGLFKGNTAANAIDLVYMTGILPIPKGVSQSSLNNFTEYNMLNPDGLEEYFGFTQEEVDSLCDRFDMDKEEMRHWYNGYNYGNLSIYNPWSVVNAVTDKRYDDYWNATCSIEALTTYMNYGDGLLKKDMMSLMEGKEVKLNPRLFDNDLTKVDSRDAALTVLIHFGYLSYDSENSTCRIPNYEIKQAFMTAFKILNWD